MMEQMKELTKTLEAMNVSKEDLRALLQSFEEAGEKKQIPPTQKSLDAAGGEERGGGKEQVLEREGRGVSCSERERGGGMQGGEERAKGAAGGRCVDRRGGAGGGGLHSEGGGRGGEVEEGVGKEGFRRAHLWMRPAYPGGVFFSIINC